MSQNCAATIGNFDGVHLGHQELVRATVRAARDLSARSGDGKPRLSRVFTFEPHPAQFFSRRNYVPLCDPAERSARLGALGADEVVVLPFTRELASRTAEEFSAMLSDRYGVQKIVIGHDFCMGCDHAGFAGLTDIGRRHGFSVEALSAVRLPGGEIVSSSAIRDALARGDVRLAFAMLGRPYSLANEIMRGDGRGGPLLGFPTANLRVGETLVPRNGVYASRCRIFDSPGQHARSFLTTDIPAFMGVTNIGTLPTFKNGSHRTIETHLLDFSGDIYGKILEIEFLDLLREEKKFASAQELKAQIAADADARRILG